MEYKEQLKNLDYSKVNNFLSENTLNFGNRTVVTSAILILASLNFLSIEGIEIEGITLSINTTIIIVVILLVNLYYYQQFFISLKVDDSKYVSPEEYTQFGKDLNTVSEPIKAQLLEYISKGKEMTEKLVSPDLTAKEGLKLEKEVSLVYEEIKKFQEILERTKNAVIADNLKAQKFAKLTNSYNRLNARMPKWIYYLGLVSVIFRFIIFSYQVYKIQEHPLDYIIENEMNYYKVIFESKELKDALKK
ncbi:hypothetical protein CEY12_00800 [Chryseobacterium sp. T16E-39]|uniref:hypothetical protein n=1 Tax=Chryseobacterium sp. T16E-39 TaxID=2015076 RepID=UPI000B5B1448|nr:hypothetical protein [Chryseobacterium sp. T16E-39]ASK28738.1 hypothetical protein CEY12_00800 [Chryseobacterium sp. T16E-39]